MCGIVGIHGRQQDGWVERMNEVQHHRGPDDSGVYRDRDAGLALAVRRLAIIDIAGGKQPITTADGRHTLVYNGEIYNAAELRRELEAAGERFATAHSDTEVLLKLLVRHGADALPRLNGMFAFAFYDRAEATLLCARDRLGIKPFYYLSGKGRFAFASELKSLITLPFVERNLDRQSLFHYLSLMYVPGRRTIFDGIDRLAPGHTLTYRLDDGSVSTACWWAPRFAPDTSVPKGEWTERIRAGLEAACARWAVSDVPVACSLSGGLDSSAIVGLMAERGAKISTYSLGFTGAGEGDWNELPLARMVAQKWQTEHHELVMDPDSLLDDLTRMVWHLDEPYGGGLPSWTVFKMMGRDVKVGLTGTGGDELFGNYGKWRGLEGNALTRRFRTGLDADAFRRHFFEPFYYLADDAKRDLLAGGGEGLEDSSAYLFERYRNASGASARDRICALDMTTQLPEEFLMMTDRFAMAHSVEARTPFLDHELVELVMAIPDTVRTHRRDLKGLLRSSISPLLPPALLSAPKKGFVLPLKLWLRGRLRPLCERLLAKERLQAQALFRTDIHDRIVAPHLDGRADHTSRLWALLMFQIWHALFIERPDPSAAPPTIAELIET